MRQIILAERSLLVGDEMASLLLTYAAVVAQADRGDTILFTALDQNGQQTRVTVLLNSGTVLMSREADSALPEPDNDDVVRSLRSKVDAYRITQIFPED